MMTTLQLEISPEQLLQAIGRLETPVLEQLASEISLIRGRRYAPSLSKTESQLLQQISAATLPNAERVHLNELGIKAESQMLSDAEREKFIMLSERSERLNVERLQAISDLAAVRDQPFLEVMSELGLFNQYVP